MAEDNTPIDRGFRPRLHWTDLVTVPADLEPPRRDRFMEALDLDRQAQAGVIDLINRAATK